MTQQEIKETDVEALDARVYTELVRMGVNPVTPTDVAARVKIATRQKVTGSLMRLRAQGKTLRYDDGTWGLLTKGLKKDPVAKEEPAKLFAPPEGPTGNISGGDLWDSYYAAVKANDEMEINALLSESGRALLDRIGDSFPNPDEKIAFIKGFLTGMGLSEDV